MTGGGVPATGGQVALRRSLGLTDSVLIGLGAMLGAGVFAAFAPAAEAAGSGLLVALLIAAVVAYCNASSSAALAAVHPQAGGTYLYGRRELGPAWGFLAGWAFVVGKTASCAAMAMTAGAYGWPSHPRWAAAAAVVAVTSINLLGITKTAAVNRVLVAVTVLVLLGVVVASLGGGDVDSAGLHPLLASGGYGVLQAAGLLFFAFAGYARLATLGEEVRDPERTIPRAIPIALGLVVAIYALVGLSLLLVLGPERLAISPAPLRDAVAAGSLHPYAGIVRVGAVTACLGVLLSAMAGVGRTTLAMARDHELPGGLASVHARFGTPLRAEVVLGVVVLVIVVLADVRDAIGFSSAGVLVYYAVTNVSAWQLTGRRRRRGIALFGGIGCLLLAGTLPVQSLLIGAGVLAAGIAARTLRVWGQCPGRQNR